MEAELDVEPEEDLERERDLEARRDFEAERDLEADEDLGGFEDLLPWESEGPVQRQLVKPSTETSKILFNIEVGTWLTSPSSKMQGVTS